jgi:hypothetical protein
MAVTQSSVAHHEDLIRVGEMLVDHREYLTALLPDPEQQQHLAEAIDHAGEQLSSRPRRGFAGAIAYAMFQLRLGGPAAQPLDTATASTAELGCGSDSTSCMSP